MSGHFYLKVRDGETSFPFLLAFFSLVIEEK